MNTNNPSELLNTILNIVGSAPQSRPSRTSRFCSIPIDMVNEEKTIYIYAELPGVQKEHIVIDVYNNTLTISAEKTHSYNNPAVNELKFGKFQRVLTLPICITRSETVSSTYQNGVLKIKINKAVEEANRFSVRLTE